MEVSLIAKMHGSWLGKHSWKCQNKWKLSGQNRWKLICRENRWKLVRQQKWIEVDCEKKVGVKKRMDVISSKTGGSLCVAKIDGNGSVRKNRWKLDGKRRVIIMKSARLSYAGHT